MLDLVKGQSYRVLLPAMQYEYRDYISAEFEGTFQGRREISTIAKPETADDVVLPDFASFVFYIDGDPNRKAEVEEPHLAAGSIVWSLQHHTV